MGTTHTQFYRKVICASRKSKGIFRTPDGIEKLLRTRSKNYRPSAALRLGPDSFLTFAR
jgi:hypothetical protein